MQDEKQAPGKTRRGTPVECWDGQTIYLPPLMATAEGARLIRLCGEKEQSPVADIVEALGVCVRQGLRVNGYGDDEIENIMARLPLVREKTQKAVFGALMNGNAD